MRDSGSILFLIILLAFIFHQLGQKLFGISLPMLDSYIDPVLGMPLLLYAHLTERRFLWGLGPKFQLSALETILVTVITALISEFVFPLFTDLFHYDPYDFIAFAVGAILFYFTMNNKKSPKAA